MEPKNELQSVPRALESQPKDIVAFLLENAKKIAKEKIRQECKDKNLSESQVDGEVEGQKFYITLLSSEKRLVTSPRVNEESGRLEADVIIDNNIGKGNFKLEEISNIEPA